MKKYYSPALLVLFFVSCNGQETVSIGDTVAVVKEIIVKHSGSFAFWTDELYNKSVKKDKPVYPNFIRSISEDKEGQMWFATYEGIYRYDGMTFFRFHEGGVNADRVFCN